MSSSKKPVACFVTLALPHYRTRFHELVRENLAGRGIGYRLVYSPPQGAEARKNDSGAIDWAEQVPARSLNVFGQDIFWQPVLSMTRNDDLVIIGQQSRLVVNYLLQLRPWLRPGRNRRQRVAFFGHGKNFQSGALGTLGIPGRMGGMEGVAARWKRFWLARVHWWFAYTGQVADIVAAAGFPRERITVFNNAIDTAAIGHEVASIRAGEVDTLRRSMGITSGNVGTCIGGMYPEKRLEFLIESALLVRKAVPDFQLVLVGDGVDAHLARQAAARHDFIHYTGARFGRDKTVLAMMAKLFLAPGLVGLAVLDSFAYGLPMVTTDIPWHSPEIGYLQHGVNGIIVRDHGDVAAYAGAVTALLRDEDRYAILRSNALESSKNHSIEAMANRFAEGVARALA